MKAGWMPLKQWLAEEAAREHVCSTAVFNRLRKQGRYTLQERRKNKRVVFVRAVKVNVVPTRYGMNKTKLAQMAIGESFSGVTLQQRRGLYLMAQQMGIKLHARGATMTRVV